MLTVSFYFPAGHPAHRRHAGQDGRAGGGKAPGGHRHPGPCPHRHRRLWHRLWQRRIWGLLTAPVTPIPISPPTCKRGAQRGVRGGLWKGLHRNTLSFSLLSSCHCILHTCIRDSQTQWLEGFLGGNKTKQKWKKKKKRKVYRKCAAKTERARLCILTQYTIAP